jgi:hypothetical protein
MIHVAKRRERRKSEAHCSTARDAVVAHRNWLNSRVPCAEEWIVTPVYLPASPAVQRRRVVVDLLGCSLLVAVLKNANAERTR